MLKWIAAQCRQFRASARVLGSMVGLEPGSRVTEGERHPLQPKGRPMMSSTAATTPRNPRRVAARLTRAAALVTLTIAGLGLQAPAGASAADSCPNAAFRVGASAQLAECRAYEQVMPAVKDFGFGSYVTPPQGFSSRAGGAVAFRTFGPLPGSVAAPFENFYLAQRDESGWDVRPITPPSEVVPGHGTYPQTNAFSPDLLQTVFLGGNPPLVPEADPDIGNLYVRDNATGAYRLISTIQGGQYTSYMTFAAASADWSHVVFEASDAYLPGMPEDGSTLKLYENVGGELRNVGIAPDGTPMNNVRIASTSAAYRATHAVSDDGSRIFFMGDGGVYVRENGTTTVNASASQRSTPDPNGTRLAQFWSATADGGRVFFTSSEALTDDANTGTDGSSNPTDAGSNLYAYDVDSGKLTDLSVDTNPADTATGANVQGVVGASDDGAYVYFVATGDLGGGATSGAPNLYLWHAGAVTFIATLDWGDAGAWSLSVSSMTSRVTPDGRHAVWQSVAPLTGYDNTDAATGVPDSEVYRYAADSDTLTCVSCRSDGTAPQGSATITLPPMGQTNVPRNVTDDGKRVFFDSTDAVVSRDANGKPDVYEWVDGAAHLVSDGVSGFAATFVDASADGTDILISTREQLVPEDTDENTDLYDARLGGGFPHSTTLPKPCALSDCRPGAAQEAPGLSPGSALLSGPGDAERAQASFSIRPVSKAARRAAARTGRLVVPVFVSAAGRVSAVASARIGARSRSIGRAAASAHRSGVLRVTVRLSRAARAVLARGGTVRTHIKVTYSKASGARQATLTLHR